MKKNTEATRRVKSEVEALKSLKKHKHILRYIDHFETKYDVGIITELCQKTDLFDIISEYGTLSEK